MRSAPECRLFHIPTQEETDLNISTSPLTTLLLQLSCSFIRNI